MLFLDLKFSPELVEIANDNLPDEITLTTTQSRFLAEWSGYKFIIKESIGFSIMHPDGKSGLDSRLFIHWIPSVDGYNLIYTPKLKSLYIRGENFNHHEEMLNKMAGHLPMLSDGEVSYGQEIIIQLPETAVCIPAKINPDGSGKRSYLLLSEFISKYYDLFLFLKGYYRS